MDFVCFVDFVSVSDVGAYSDGPSENVCPNAKKSLQTFINGVCSDFFKSNRLKTCAELFRRHYFF
ncbi:hypothetical protein MM809_32335, partial [Klebsiella pneumoniae]|nr:hypothetical protein [Klebsiella pneumoniae]